MPTDRIVEVHPNAFALAETFSFTGEESVDPNLLGQREPSSAKDRWPEDAMKSRDVFTNDVHLRRPLRFIAGLGKPDCRQVVRQGVEPDVDHLVSAVARREWKRDTPVEIRP